MRTHQTFSSPPVKNQVKPFKKDVSNSATQDSMMNVHNKIYVTHSMTKWKSKIHVVTHNYQRFSSLQ